MIAHQPVFILAPPRSFTSVICAMLGQHSQAYGLPETQLFVTETMAEWCQLCNQTTFPLSHGLLRAVAQLYFGLQTGETIALAHRWVSARVHYSTGMVFAVLVERVNPLVVLEKSPSMVYQLEFMERTLRTFPRARYIHLLRHPRGFCESVLKSIRKTQEQALAPPWLLYLASYPKEPTRDDWARQRSTEIDPQRAWYSFHTNICSFLQKVPDDRKIQTRGEDLLTDPERCLREISSWLGLSSSSAEIDRMKHPEDSPYASFGPEGALFGNDPNFLENPRVQPERGKQQSLEGALPWRKDGQGFYPEVKRLASQFGYS